MDIIRRDTDYAFRIAVKLAEGYDRENPFSAKVLAKETQVSYPLTCKILQKLANAGIVQSIMGPKGGFKLAKKPENIRFNKLIEVIQGPLRVNRCLMGGYKCPQKGQCPAHPKMTELQTQIEEYLKELTLNDFISRENKND